MPEVKIDVASITDAEWDVSMRMIQPAIKRFYETPGVREAFEQWQASEECQRLMQRLS